MTKSWLKAAGVRAIKTMAQAFVACVGVATVMSEVDWLRILSTALLSGILSVVTSIAGLPEVED